MIRKVVLAAVVALMSVTSLEAQEFAPSDGRGQHARGEMRGDHRDRGPRGDRGERRRRQDGEGKPDRPDPKMFKRQNAELFITDREFFTTPEARRIGDQLVLFQRVTGGWPKNTDMTKPLTAAERDAVLAQRNRRDDSTTDNNATWLQMRYLARLYRATADDFYRAAFLRGVDFLRSGQYPNGGWPQFWPETKGYQFHITYNDGAMGGTMRLFRDIYEAEYPFDGDLTAEPLRRVLRNAFDRGVQCILATQIVVDGEPTVWCQQHDHVTLLPAKARAYELPSFCSAESAGLVGLLMEIPNPSPEVKRAIHGAMRWFDKYKLTGIRVEHYKADGDRGFDVRVVEDETARPIWARFYDLKYCEPYFSDRDGVMRRNLNEIGYERRTGYSWFSTSPADLYPKYEKWAEKNDPANRVNISLDTPGANKNGTIKLGRRAEKKLEAFDAIVKPGESIQAAIDKAPADMNKKDAYKILIRNGVYREKVIIDRPNIVLVGENRDSVQLIYPELASKVTEKEFRGKPSGNGVIVIQEGADDVVISGMTVYNNYGSTVEPTTAHQMAIFGRGTRTIVINSNIKADGNDALSLWARDAGGMYYHADLDIECAGVDFLCPRGWCYATRCRFTGDGHALIWHDGRGDKDKKLVITNSRFDSKTPSPLGRYHHDSQFYLVNCTMSERVLDKPIAYAYTDKVLDPCPWGQRTYFYGCTREGGHSGWLANNLSTAPDAPEFHGVTAAWTFGEKWQPEARIRELWDVLAY